MTTNPTPLPVPTQWTLTTLAGASIPTPIEASLAAETLGIHVHNPDDLPMQLDPTTWMLDTPYTVVLKLAADGEVAISNNAYEAQAEWPDHVAAPGPTFDRPLDALRHHVSGAVDRDEAEPLVEVPADRCPACGEPIDYCQGHGEIGDPDGFDTLRRHDEGDHLDCHSNGCGDAGEDLRPPLLEEGHRAKLAERLEESLMDSMDWVEQDHSDADLASILQYAAFGTFGRVEAIPDGYTVVRVDDLQEVLTSNLSPAECDPDDYADQDDPTDDGSAAQVEAQAAWDRLCDAARVTRGIPFRYPTA